MDKMASMFTGACYFAGFGANLNCGVDATLFSDLAAYNSPAGSPATITTYNVPQGALIWVPTNGSRGLRVTVSGSTANNANAKTVQLKIGGAIAVTLPLTISVVDLWTMTATVQVNPAAGSQAQTLLAASGVHGIANGAFAGVMGAGPTISFDATIAVPILVVASTQTSAADIIQRGIYVELF